MAPQMGENVREFLMSHLSPEDQLVVKTILSTILNKDNISCNRLADIVHGTTHEELDHSKPCEFSSMSSFSSTGNLHCPVAIRLSRLQQEMQWLHSDMNSESDKNTMLGQKLEDLYKKVKMMEDKNTELTQSLKDSLTKDVTLKPDATVSKLKGQLKRLQLECDSVSQKYCDLNISHEHLLSQQEKDRKLIRQLQIELNDETARYQCEMMDFQTKLEAVRTENADLKRLVNEQKQWIDVLEEERNRNCSVNQTLPFSPTASTGGERENIGFTLLSLEVERLQGELATLRTEASVERQRFHAERQIVYQERQSLQQELETMAHQLSDTLRSHQCIKQQLEEARMHINDISNHCHLLQQEKLQLSDALRAEMSRTQHLEHSNISCITGQSMEMLVDAGLSSQDMELTNSRLLLDDVHEELYRHPSTRRLRPVRLSQSADPSIGYRGGPHSVRSSHRRSNPSCWGFPCSKVLWRSYRGATAHSRAMQRARSGPKGASFVADHLNSARRRSMKPLRAAQAPRQLQYQTLKVPALTVDNGDDSLKIPRGAGCFFTCDDEEGELFSSSYISQIAAFNRKKDSSIKPTSDNQLMQTPAPVATLTAAEDSTEYQLSSLHVPSAGDLHSSSALRQSTRIDTTPKTNTNARQHRPLERTDMETPTQSAKRRIFAPRILCTPSLSSPPTPTTPKSHKLVRKRNSSPQSCRSTARLTPASIIKKVQSKWRMYHESVAESSMSNPFTPGRKSLALNLFCNPLAAKGYDSQV